MHYQYSYYNSALFNLIPKLSLKDNLDWQNYLLVYTFDYQKEPISIYKPLHKFFLLYFYFPCVYFYLNPFKIQINSHILNEALLGYFNLLWIVLEQLYAILTMEIIIT